MSGVAQSVAHLTLDFGSGHDSRVAGLSPMSGSALSMEPSWDSPLALPLPLSPACVFSLSPFKLKNK